MNASCREYGFLRVAAGDARPPVRGRSVSMKQLDLPGNCQDLQATGAQRGGDLGEGTTRNGADCTEGGSARSVHANLRPNLFVLSFCEDMSFYQLGSVVVGPSGDDGLRLRRCHGGQLRQILLGSLVDIHWPFSR